jgi:hypothetical protein
MAKGPEIPKTDSAEIEILIEHHKQNRLEQRDVELIELLLRTVMALVNLLQRKNMSIKRLRDLIFGRRTEKRKTGSVSQPEDKPEEGAGCDPGAEREVSEKSQRQRQAGPQGHGRRATAQYRGAKKVECWHEQYQAGAKCPEAAFSRPCPMLSSAVPEPPSLPANDAKRDSI